VAVLDIGDKIFDLLAVADIVFWPVAMDAKFHHVEAMEDGYIDVTLYNGGIVNEENKEIAELLRRKSKVMIALGSCACFGGIPGLANVASREEILKKVYQETPSTDNPENIRPETRTPYVHEDVYLPERLRVAKALDQVVDVDYYLPGCAPAEGLVGKAVDVLANFHSTGELPPKGAVIAGKTSVCDACDLNTENKVAPGIRRAYAIPEDNEKCFLEQGIICMGPATRGGCGNDCIKGMMPCRGCMGPLSGVTDQGAKMISALASVLGVSEDGEQDPEAMKALVEQILDPLGTFYRYALPKGLINRRYRED
jgi:F420-non-reducing hydrogenase small subunit